MNLIILSGLSGSGKTVALHAMEDVGFYCADNIPLNLLISFVKELKLSNRHYFENVAIGIDARATFDDVNSFADVLATLGELVDSVQVLYLMAQEDVLVKRFSETRRKHPLSQVDRTLSEAIRYESDILSYIENRADMVIDTSAMLAKELRNKIQVHFKQQKIGQHGNLSILFQSFGFKHGLPSDSSFVFDVRYLPNPHWEPKLRELSGKDAQVKSFLQQQQDVAKTIASISTYLGKWLPYFQRENRRYVTVCIGCTGGQHRSVYIAECLYDIFKTEYDNVSVRHSQLNDD